MPDTLIIKNKKIERVIFEDVDDGYFKQTESLINAENWNLIEKNSCNLYIITGENGIGKTQLLAYIKNGMNRCKGQISFRYMPGPNDSYVLVDSDEDAELAVKSKDPFDDFKKAFAQFREQDSNMKSLKVFFNQIEKTKIFKNYAQKFITLKEQTSDNDEKELYALYQEIIMEPNIKSNDYEPINHLIEIYKYLNGTYRKVQEYYLKANPSNLSRAIEIEADQRNFDSNQKKQTYIKKTKLQLYSEESLDEYVKNHVEKNMNQKIEKINKLLHTFNFRLNLSQDSVNLQKFIMGQWVNVNGGTSSGERSLLNFISLQYENNQDFQEVDVLLLDEPDRHFEPKLIENFFKIIYDNFAKLQNMQVIITTHRPDTIALAPEGCIYKMDKNGNGRIFIRPCDKLNALFKLTYNLRAIVNFKSRVYVEAFDDNQLYEAIYRILYQYSCFIREKNNEENNHDKKWPNLEKYFNEDIYLKTTENRILSRRYQLEFFPTCLDDKASSGGFNQVVYRVKNDLAASTFLSKNQYNQGFLPIEKQKSFAILDSDFGTENEKEFEKLDDEIKKRMLKNKRYNIENFLFDPILFCSFFESEEKFEETFKKAGFKENQDLNEFKNLICKCISSIRQNRDVHINSKVYFKYLIEKTFNHKIDKAHEAIKNLKINDEKIIGEVPKEVDDTLKNIKIDLKELIKDVTDFQKSQKLEIKKQAEVIPYLENLVKLIDELKKKLHSKDSNIKLNTLLEEVSQKFKLGDDYDTKLNELIEYYLNINNTQKMHYFSYKIVNSRSEPNVRSNMEPVILALDYPIFLLKINGHHIENSIPLFYTKPEVQTSNGVQGKKKLYDHIFEKLLDYKFDKISNELQVFIPFDLFSLFNELNNKVRKQFKQKLS